MATLATFAAVLGVTLLAVVLHLRRTHRHAGEPAASCPHCGYALASATTHCPRCAVPQQIFELTRARTVQPAASVSDRGGKLHAAVRADLCVGCGACVPACPEEGAIRLAGKVAVVDKDRCTGHGRCVEACPVGGIFLTTGEMVQRMDVPDVRPDFQSNVPGVYVVGELGGRGLIKNAINEGRIAVERIARELGGVARPADARIVDLAIVGSGPAGLSAGLEAKRAGLSSLILEQGTLADSIRRYPRHKLLLAEPVAVPLYGELWVADAAKETLLEVWESLIRAHGLDVRTNRRVTELSRENGVFSVRGPGFRVRARRVVLAMGRRGTPRRLDVPGEDLAKVFYDIAEMEAFRQSKIVVVGGGDSALESAVGLANQNGTEVTLAYRGTTFDRAKERNVTKLAAEESAGRIRVLRGGVVTRIEPHEVELDVGGVRQVIPNDYVIVRVGGEPPAAFLGKVGIRTVTKEVPIPDPALSAVVSGTAA
ncbi:MAG: NAD(P)-binding domain-containing protein [Candidatus Eiseniibacteriota bacterium]